MSDINNHLTNDQVRKIIFDESNNIITSINSIAKKYPMQGNEIVANIASNIFRLCMAHLINQGLHEDVIHIIDKVSNDIFNKLESEQYN